MILVGTQEILLRGADIVKVGIGGGAVCSTRIKTGFGVPNLTAIRNSARVIAPERPISPALLRKGPGGSSFR